MGTEGLARATAAFASPETWSLMSCSGEDETTDENPESQEMLEEQLVRMLTREVMDLISKWRGNQG